VLAVEEDPAALWSPVFPWSPVLPASPVVPVVVAAVVEAAPSG
jgi:hypothetical protein